MRYLLVIIILNLFSNDLYSQISGSSYRVEVKQFYPSPYFKDSLISGPLNWTETYIESQLIKKTFLNFGYERNMEKIDNFEYNEFGQLVKSWSELKTPNGERVDSVVNNYSDNELKSTKNYENGILNSFVNFYYKEDTTLVVFDSKDTTQFIFLEEILGNGRSESRQYLRNGQLYYDRVAHFDQNDNVILVTQSYNGIREVRNKYEYIYDEFNRVVEKRNFADGKDELSLLEIRKIY